MFIYELLHKPSVPFVFVEIRFEATLILMLEVKMSQSVEINSLYNLSVYHSTLFPDSRSISEKQTIQTKAVHIKKDNYSNTSS